MNIYDQGRYIMGGNPILEIGRGGQYHNVTLEGRGTAPKGHGGIRINSLYPYTPKV